MATQVQFRRGTTGETALFTGAVGEVTVDTTKDTCVVHDGITQGGYALMREDGSNMLLSSGSLSSCALRFAADPNTGLVNPGPDQLSIVTGGVARIFIDSSGGATFSNNVVMGGSLNVGAWGGTTVTHGYGGTGHTTYSPGQLLIGKADGSLAKATLTASTGVTITNGDGTITISAVGLGGTVTAVTGSSPLASSGGTTPNITIQDATTAQKGAVQLEDSTSSTSLTTAATPNSVKNAYDLANAALPQSGGSVSGDITIHNQADLRFADADSSNWVAFQAPATVTTNVTWTLPNADGTFGQVLKTNGAGLLSWGTGGGGGGGSVSISDTAPIAPTTGEIWFDSANGRTYIYYNDGNTSQWVDLAPQGLMSIVAGDSPPPAPTNGSIWYDSVGGRTYIYYNDGNTSQWVDSAPQQTGPQPLITLGNTTAEVFDTGSDGRFVVTTEGVERFRTNSSGYTGFGTTTPGSTVDIKGTLRLSGSTSGYVGLAPAATAGSTTYTLPTADGTLGQLLSTNGSGTLSWTNPPQGFSRFKAYFYSGF